MGIADTIEFTLETTLSQTLTDHKHIKVTRPGWWLVYRGIYEPGVWRLRDCQMGEQLWNCNISLLPPSFSSLSHHSHLCHLCHLCLHCHLCQSMECIITTMQCRHHDHQNQGSHECETMVRAVGEMCRELSRLRLSPVFTKYNFPHHESDNVGVMLCDRIATTRSVMIVMIRSKIVSALVRRLTLAFPYGRDSE